MIELNLNISKLRPSLALILKLFLGQHSDAVTILGGSCGKDPSNLSPRQAFQKSQNLVGFVFTTCPLRAEIVDSTLKNPVRMG